MKKKNMGKNLMTAKQEYKEALFKLQLAELNFNYAIPELFDLANAELTASRLRVDAMKNIYAKLLTH